MEDEYSAHIQENKRKLANIIILAMETIACDVQEVDKMDRYEDLEHWVECFVEGLCWDLKQ